MAGIEEGQQDFDEMEEHEQNEEGQALDVSTIFDNDTAFDFPRANVVENEDLVGTPGYGDGDLDDWESEDIDQRLKRLSQKERTALKSRITYTKKKILTKLTGQVVNKNGKGTLSYKLYEDITLRYDPETKQPNGVRYNGVLVMVKRGDNLVPNKRATVALPNFLKAVREASGLPETTTRGQVSAKISEVTGELTPSPETVNSIRRDLSRKLREAQNNAITPGVEEETGFGLEDTKRRVDKCY